MYHVRRSSFTPAKSGAKPCAPKTRVTNRMNAALSRRRRMSICSNSLYARFLSPSPSVSQWQCGTCGIGGRRSGVGFALTPHFVTSPGGRVTADRGRERGGRGEDGIMTIQGRHKGWKTQRLSLYMHAKFGRGGGGRGKRTHPLPVSLTRKSTPHIHKSTTEPCVRMLVPYNN